MTELAARSRSNRTLALAALCAAGTLACGPSLFEVAIETPIQPKLDISAFQRVLIAGFVAGGTDDVDTNQETVRLRPQSAADEILAENHRRRRAAARRYRPGSEQSSKQDALTRHTGTGRHLRRSRRPRLGDECRTGRHGRAGAATGEDQGRKGPRAVRAPVCRTPHTGRRSAKSTRTH